VDALNPHQFRFPPDRTDPADRPYWASVLELPEAPAETWSLSRPGVPRGSVLHTTLRTAALGGRRHVTVYRPAARHELLALLVVFDGHLSRTALNIPTTLDNLIAAGRIPPTLAVFVHAPSGARRFRELRPSNALRHFVTHELMPWACRRFPLTHDPNRRVIAGSSLGGLAAAYIAMIAPHLFGNVIAQSGAFWWPASPSQRSQWLIRAYADRDALPIRFYLDVGDHETDSPRDDELDQLTVNRRLREVLVDRGYQVTYTEYVGAHDYINWRRTFGDGLLASGFGGLLGWRLAAVARGRLSGRLRSGGGGTTVAVGLHDCDGDAAALVYLVALLLCPGADGGVLIAVRGRAACGPAGRSDDAAAAHLAAGLDVGLHRLTKFETVLSAQVDLVADAVQTERHRLVSLTAVEIVRQHCDDLPCHARPLISAEQKSTYIGWVARLPDTTCGDHSWQRVDGYAQPRPGPDEEPAPARAAFPTTRFAAIVMSSLSAWLVPAAEPGCCRGRRRLTLQLRRLQPR
jgi:enterochelin esterase-like enzyme